MAQPEGRGAQGRHGPAGGALRGPGAEQASEWGSQREAPVWRTSQRFLTGGGGEGK